MRPWLAALGGRRRSDPIRHGGTGSSAYGHSIEALEPRTLLSASFAPAFAGQFPSTLTGGRHARVTVRLSNQGDAAAAPAAVSLYASADASLDAGDALLATAARRGSVKPGRSAPVKFHFDTPEALPGGNYYLIARVDGTAAPFDSASAPAPAVASSATVRVEPSFVDLSARITRLPHGEVEVGGGGHDETIDVEVSNAGNAPAVGPVEVRLYLSADAQLDSNDTAAGVVPPRQLKIPPGQSRTVPARISVPQGTTPGLYYVLAVVDSSNAIAETDETNNLAASAAPISVVPAASHDHGDGGHSHHYHGYFGAGGYYDIGGYDVGYYDDTGGEPADDGGYDVPPDEPLPPGDDYSPPPASEPSTEPSSAPSAQPSDEGGGGSSDTGGADWSDPGSGWSDAPSSSYDDYTGGGSDF